VDKKTPITVPERLDNLATLFQRRNPVYGDGYKKFGAQAFALTGPVTLSTPEDMGRFAILLQVIAKTARYSNNFATGGHSDSLDDAAVYAMMLQDLDHDLPPKRKG
jgi:hypothetical protein